jgi:hypothetical protein
VISRLFGSGFSFFPATTKLMAGLTATDMVWVSFNQGYYFLEYDP